MKKGDWVIAKQTGLGTWRTHLQIEEEKIMRVEREGLRSEQVGTVGVGAHYSEPLVISRNSLWGSSSSLRSLSAISTQLLLTQRLQGESCHCLPYAERLC